MRWGPPAADETEGAREGAADGSAEADGPRVGTPVGGGDRDGADSSQRTLRWKTPSSAGDSADTTM